MIKYSIGALLFATALTGCATQETAVEAPVAAEAAEMAAPEAADAAIQPECPEGAEDCDTGGTEFRPPTR